MSKTILLADDSVTIRKVVELTFMDEDFELVSVGFGDQAVEQLPELDPDLVIADIHMPGLNGYDVCRVAKEHRRERPVLLLVGTFEPFDADELAASGADRHLKKPFDSQELLQTVRDLLAGGEAASEDEAATGSEDALAGAPRELGLEDAAPVRAEAVTEELPTDGLEMPDESTPPVPAEAAAPSAGGESEPAGGSAVGNGDAELSDESVERIARRVAELLGPETLREVAWEVVPDLAEVVIKERLRELESQLD